MHLLIDHNKLPVDREPIGTATLTTAPRRK
jgi:hypothetical protein